MSRAVACAVVALVVAWAVPCLAETLADLQMEYAAVESQIRDLQQKPSADANIKQLQEAVAAAESALEKAYSDIPEIKDADAKVAAAKTKLDGCQTAFAEAIKKNEGAEAVQAPRQALITAIMALQKADKNDKEKYAALEKAFLDASKVLRDAYARVPEVREAETRVSDARTEVSDRTKERDALRRKSADVPAVKEAVRKLADAKAARAKAMADIPEMKDLLKKKADVEKRLIDAMRKPPAGKADEPKK